MISFPHAKINLGLNILRKREDGYHDLESLFVPVPWADVLEVIKASDFSFSQSGLEIPPDGKANLCQRAYELLYESYSLAPVAIHLHKAIPIGAGLGGGSSDGAFMLKMLRDLFDLPLTNLELMDYARQLGSDCAFFLQSEAQFCYEKGDVFEAFPSDLKNIFIVLIYPDLQISTKEAYGLVKAAPAEMPLREVLQKPFDIWREELQNDFEKFIIPHYPIIAEIKAQLYELGAFYASMSGSGSTLFGLFKEEVDLRKHFPENYRIWQSFL